MQESESELVLLVEDDPGISELILEALSQLRLETATAATGRQGLEWLKSQTPSLVILDYSLPDMNGFQFLSDARSLNIHIPSFIVATGVGDERTAVELMKNGARDYLVKDSNFLDILPISVKRVLAWSKTERTLQKAQTELNRMALVVEQAADSIMITDLAGRIEYVNPAFEKVTGYTKAEAIGQKPRFLRSGKHDSGFYATMWESISSGRTWTGRFINKRKDGTLFHEDATIFAIQDQDGKILQYAAVKKDITQEVEIQEQLRQAHKMEAVGLLAGGVAHDLNNLLTPILGYGEMLLGDPSLAPPHHHDVEQIVTAGKKARDLVRQLMAFGRKQVLEMRAIDLNSIITDFTKLLRRTLREDIRIVLNLSTRSCHVRADRSQMEQVLMNLLVNAQDAMPQGGKLSIETDTVELDEQYTATHLGAIPGPYVVLTVGDSGCGMEKETLSRIFEPFYTTKTLGKGTGLGLATVYGIVKQHGGNITVYSEPGQGTSFRIYLPELLEPETAAGMKTASETLPTGNETILVSEDDPSVRQLTSSMLHRLGYRVYSEETPDGCLRVLNELQRPIDLLLTDVVMPYMNGKELHALLAGKIPNLKVLYMSGHTTHVIAELGVLEEGMFFIQKPFTLKVLSEKIREVLDHKKTNP